jgi:hypothetical protein
VGNLKKEDHSPCQPGSPIFKTTRAKSTGGIAQEVERLPRKCEALSSDPSTTKKEEELKKELNHRKQLEKIPSKLYNQG